jgi:hypothetical protein
MKAYSFYALIFLFLASLITLLIGCEYDVTEPLWYKPPTSTAIAIIDSIVPAQAPPGVNIITIYGKNLTGSLDTSYFQNFTGRDTAIAYNGIYFDKLPVTIVKVSSTSVKVRRPNISGDSIVVKVAPNIAYVGAKTGPYKVDPVMEKTDYFLTNVELNVVAVDNAENLYVLERDSRVLSKFDSSGVKTRTDTLFRTLTSAPQDGKISPLDGMLYVTGNVPLRPNVSIRRVNLTNGTVNNNWVQLAAGRGVTYCDFDANGNLYVGGYNTTGPQYSGLIVVTPAGAAGVTYTPYYTSAFITSICVYQGWVYVASKVGLMSPETITRHQILDANGSVGSTEETILDMSTLGSSLSTRTIRQISFASDGTIYLGSTTSDPMLVVTPMTVIPQEVDYFYKGIIPKCTKYSACWGSGTILYLIGGDSFVGNRWDIYKIDMGATVGAR